MSHLPRGYEHKKCESCEPDVTIRVESVMTDRYWIFRARRCAGLVADFNMILMHRRPVGSDQQVMRACSSHGALHVHVRQPGKRRPERLFIEPFDGPDDLDGAYQGMAVSLPVTSEEVLYRVGWLR